MPVHRLVGDVQAAPSRQTVKLRAGPIPGELPDSPVVISQADVLLENTRMLTLLASRGYVTLSRQSSEVRVAVGAAQPAGAMQRDRGRPAP
jgi:hypothetical protein